MSDETVKNQDLDLDKRPEEDIDEAALLQQVDDILAEDDPDFISEIEQIHKSSQNADFSIIDHTLAINHQVQSKILQSLRKPFEIKSNTKSVAIFWVVLLVLVSATVLVWKNKKNWFESSLFLTSYSELNSDVKDYNPNSELENFYDNSRFSKNLVTLPQIYVNVKPSENSGENPMLAIQITAEGLSTDAIIEVKDRESELKDKLSRATEEKTYDELVVVEGKQILVDQYRDILNQNLTKGQIRRVLLKSFVIKP